jgi:hypothetical protein
MFTIVTGIARTVEAPRKFTARLRFGESALRLVRND